MAVEQLQLLRVHGAGNILLLFCREGGGWSYLIVWENRAAF